MQPVIDYLRMNESRFIRELCEYVKFPSVSAQRERRDALIACARWICEHCKQIGLEARLCNTAGNPVLIAKTPRRPKQGAHFLVYGHYDVQPVEPIELWKTDPFSPRIEGRSLYGRGASDNKGQHFAHLKAVEAYLKTGTELPCALTFLIEGEEEVGNTNLGAFLKAHRNELRSDAVIVSDSTIPSREHPALIYSLRGIVDIELILHGPSRDLHSGIFGGTVDNPAMALCQMLSRLHDRHGRVLIPGFYDDVLPLTKYERAQLACVPSDDREQQKFLGVPKLFGEEGYTTVERRTARPTLEINSLTSGYQGEGSKTIIPSWARAKLTSRIVPNQEENKIFALLAKRLHDLKPPTVKLNIIRRPGGEPYLMQPTGPAAQAALRALRIAFAREPVLIRSGGSIPIVIDFKRYLHADTLLLGLALPDDNAHSPNEKFDLDLFSKGMLMSAALWQELAALSP